MCLGVEGRSFLLQHQKTALSLSVRSGKVAMTVLSQRQPVVSVRTQPCVPARGLGCLLSQLVGRVSRCPLFSYFGVRGNPNWFLSKLFSGLFSFLGVGIETEDFGVGVCVLSLGLRMPVPSVRVPSAPCLRKENHVWLSCPIAGSLGLYV